MFKDRKGKFMTNGPKGPEKALLKIKELENAAAAHDAVIDKLKEKGVHFVDSSRVIIDENTEIGENTVVYPDVIFEGKNMIGEGNIIYPGTRIKDSAIGNFNEIEASVILESELGNDSTYGPFAYVRPGSRIGDNVKIGDFVEVKNTTVGNGTKVSHLTYLGDADIGEKVNFGCGTVIVNYNGKQKTRTVVEDGAFVGCNTNLVSPVKVGKGAYTAAGSTITEDVPDGALAIGRARQSNKEGWVEKSGLLKK